MSAVVQLRPGGQALLTKKQLATLLGRSERWIELKQRDGLPILTGWRFEQFGRDALDLVEGRLAFAVVNGKLKMTRTEEV